MIPEELDVQDAPDTETDEPRETKQKTIRILVVEPNELPIVREIPNELAAMQRVVDGLIEVFPVGIAGAVGVCNEEGLLRGLPFNRFVPATGGVIVGTFFIAGDGVNFRSLTPQQIARAMELF